ncbi:putative jasmonic acid carboxyl methyltransferase 2 [Silene latifolia]|uniref:putative jasmonic acid carboxyl methyltransferase 2 n=1 Tax=Silene latifolia TaxID=37657 RepID=UPI003D76F39C
MTMNMLQVFHMNKGGGETSYAKNCTIQSKILSITKPYVEAAMHDYLNTGIPWHTITIAELGCSSGPTALDTVTTIMDVVETRQKVANFMVYLVDLPSNDFNGAFSFIPSLQKRVREEKGVGFGHCFIAGLPGNFYERLLPNHSLHFVHSSSSLHWLSQVPIGLDGKDGPKNMGKIYLSVTSPSHVIDAYKLQFRKDFLSFLKCRSQEVVLGGRMVLSFMGKRSSISNYEEDYFPLELIDRALMTMVSEGLVEEEKLDSLNVPLYAPSLEEVKLLIEEETSFYGDHFAAIEVEWDGGSGIEQELNSFEGRLTRGETIAKMHRAVIESMLEHHFGEDIMDELFYRYAKIWDAHLLSNENSKLTILVISLIRI